MVHLDQNPLRSKRRWGPILVALLFLFAAIGISIDHFANYFREISRYSDRFPAGTFSAAQKIAVKAYEASTSAQFQSTFEKAFEPVPKDEPLKSFDASQKRAPAAAEVLTDVSTEVSIEAPKEDLKISLDPSTWKGGAQLLPNPLYISSVESPRGRDIRGGGWVVIDVANSKIEPVELFKNPKRGVIEAKYLDGRKVVNPTTTGFPVVRGVPGLNPGGFEVFENPPCAVRYSGVSETETCEVRWRNSKLHFKFEAPVLNLEEPAQDFIFTTVSIDVGPGDLSRARWEPVVSFNESFHPIGDANRDGYPDFYVESVTGYDESGVQHLVVSAVSGEDSVVSYSKVTTRFRPRR